ncbi:MAG: alpha/beta fold hydrolase [Candidatus Methanofastidiosia archaeon]|jgi:polyhydroxybutyrate depolymerase
MYTIAKVFVIIVVIGTCGCQKRPSDQGIPEDTQSLVVDGITRTYSINVPRACTESVPVPLVIALHGGGGSSNNMANLTAFNAVSDTYGFIVVYPNGIENHWNDGRNLEKYKTQKDDIDDVHFISVLIDVICEQYTIDKNSIYVTGISNGAMMSCRIACELSEKIAAIAMVVGSMPAHLVDTCAPASPVSVLLIAGTNDPLVPFEGGEITLGGQKYGEVKSMYDTVHYWVEHNGCSETPEVTWLPDINPDDGCRVRRDIYTNGKNGTEVMFYCIEGGGHTWPGGPQYAAVRIIGKTCYDFDASEIIWRFFDEHHKVDEHLLHQK